MSGRYLVVDVETQRGFHEVDRKKLHLLKISVACAYDSGSDSYYSFEEKELHKLEDLMKQTDLIVGFNVRDFDMEVLAPYLVAPVKSFPVLDMLVEFEKSRGHRASLQSIAQATLGLSKSGSGWDAINLYKQGRIDELKQYCLDDVRITKEVYEYGVKHNSVKFMSNRDYQVHTVNVSWGSAIHDVKAKTKEENAFPTSLF